MARERKLLLSGATIINFSDDLQLGLCCLHLLLAIVKGSCGLTIQIFVGACTREFTGLFDRRNFLEDLLHRNIAAEADRKFDGFTVKDNFDARFADTF